MPTDEVIFFRGVGQPPTSQIILLYHLYHYKFPIIIIRHHYFSTLLLWPNAQRVETPSSQGRQPPANPSGPSNVESCITQAV